MTDTQTLPTGTAAEVRTALAAVADPERAAGMARLFQTGPGQYGAGDVFIGVTVPQTRAVVTLFPALPPTETELLLAGPVHEHRLAGLLILVAQFGRASAERTRDEVARRTLTDFYLAQVRAGRVFIRAGDASSTLDLAGRLLTDPEPLMHKAVGWMLREVGARIDRALLLGFLDEHAGRMPRTMLSYATEHVGPGLRAHYRGLPRPPAEVTRRGRGASG